MGRNILHLNVSHFSAAIEERCNPSLRGEPFIIAPSAGRRAIVMELSSRAFQEGVRKGMPMDEFLRRAKGMEILEPKYTLYSKAGSALYKKALTLSPVVEQISGGHIFLDLSGTKKLFGSPESYAVKIRNEINESLGIDPIAGLASSRLVSKVATRIVKPRGFISVLPGEEPNFLKHQDISLLPGIGKKLLSLMDALHIKEIGELAELPDSHITAAFGQKGFRLRESALGMDITPVKGHSSETKKISNEITLEEDTNDIEELSQIVFSLIENCGMTLRQNNMFCSRVEILLRYCDSLTSSGRENIPVLSSSDRDIFDTGRNLLKKILTRRVRVRYIRVSLSRLFQGDFQMDLFPPEEKLKRESIQKSIDCIRKKFGRDAVKSAMALKWGV